jgi:hypothetical protein
VHDVGITNITKYKNFIFNLFVKFKNFDIWDTLWHPYACALSMVLLLPVVVITNGAIV